MKPLPENILQGLVSWLGSHDEFVFLDCARVNDAEHCSYLFTSPRKWLVCSEPEGSGEFLEEADSLRQEGYHLAGWIGYEFGYLLEPSLAPLCRGEGPFAVLGIFDDPLVVDHRSVDPAAFACLSKYMENWSGETFTVSDLQTSAGKDEYLGNIAKIRDYIIAGDTYQVNYTMKLQFGFNGSPAGLYCSLRRNQAVSYGAWIRQGGRDIMSFSPELFFRAGKDHITVRPMKGTMGRGRDLAEDLRQRELLCTDIKNRSENVMIVDLLRNDLGRLLRATGGGCVRPRSLFDVETYETVLQMTSTIDGIPSKPVMPGLGDMLPALFPCGSVTGAPKIRTMEIIRELEKEPRGVYCGAIGFCGPHASVFNVPIRTVVLEGERGEMGIGSGIVFDSVPESEWEESLLKARFLTDPQPDFQLIETMLWLPEQGYWLLKEHMGRLTASAQYFLFPCDMEAIGSMLEKEAAHFASPMRVRVLLYRDGRTEMTAAGLDHGFRPVIERSAVPGYLPRVVISEIATDPGNIHLYHKTTRRELYEDEREKALREGFHEVLFCNSRGKSPREA